MTTITLNDEHVAAVLKALELYSRIGMGQFGDIVDVFGVQPELSDKLGNTYWDRKQLIEKRCKEILTPKLGPGYQGIANTETPRKCKLCWDVLRALRGDDAWEPVAGVPCPKVERV